MTILTLGVVHTAHAEDPHVFLLKWGSLGAGPGQFSDPFDAAFGVGQSGIPFVVVVDHDNHRIEKFSVDGAFQLAWGSSGSGNGQFGSPEGIAVGPDGSVYVSDRTLHRIQRFTSDGVFVSTWGTNGTGNGQFLRPLGVAVRSFDGHVYVADSQSPNRRIQEFTSSGIFVRTIGPVIPGGTNLVTPTGVAVGPGGEIYIADNSGFIEKLSDVGAFLTQWSTNSPYDLACDSDGVVYALRFAQPYIATFDPDGNPLGSWGYHGSGAGRLVDPMGMGATPGGALYVADLGNQRIQLFGKPVAAAGMDQGGLGLATAQVDSLSGNLFVSNIGSSGEDGIFINPGTVNSGPGFSFAFDNAPNSDLPGASLAMQLKGQRSGGPAGEILASIQWYSVDATTAHMLFDMNPLGVTDYDVDLYNDGNLVHHYSALPESTVVSYTFPIASFLAPGSPLNGIDISLIDKSTGNPNLIDKSTGNPTVALPMMVGGDGPHNANGIRVSGLVTNPVESMDGALVKAANWTQLVVSGEALGAFGGFHEAGASTHMSGQGDVLAITSNAPDLAMSLGIPESRLGDTSDEQAIHWEALDTSLPAPSNLSVSPAGVGTLQVSEGAGSNDVSYSAIAGNGMVSVQVFSGGSQVASVTAPAGALASVGSFPLGAGVGIMSGAAALAGGSPLSVSWNWDSGVTIDLGPSGGSSVSGDELRVVPEGISVLEVPKLTLASTQIPALNIDGETRSSIPTAVPDGAVGTQSQVAFPLASAPNPFVRSTALHYQLGRASRARLDVVDVLGRRIRTLVNEPQASGAHEVRWDGRDAQGHPLPGGVYFARLSAGSESVCQKLVLVR